MLCRRCRVWGLPIVAELHCQSSSFLDRFSDLRWNSVVKHVPNARNQSQDTVRNLRVKPARLALTTRSFVPAMITTGIVNS